MTMASNLPLENLVSCSVCFEVYTQPSILPCLHSLCWPCVQLLKTGTRISCPECRVVCPIRTIKKDFNKQQLIDIYTLYEESQTQAKEGIRAATSSGNSGRCELCQSKHKVPRSKCIQCDKNLCQECETIHGSIPICEHHKIFVLDQELTDTKASSESQNILRMLCSKEQQVRDNIARLKRHTTELNKLNANVCSEITNHEHTMISQVQGHYSNLRHEVENTVSSEVEQVSGSLKTLEEHLTAIQAKINTKTPDDATGQHGINDKAIDIEILERDLADSKRYPMLKIIIESGRGWNARNGHRVEAEKVFSTLKREQSKRNIADLSEMSENRPNSKKRTDNNTAENLELTVSSTKPKHKNMDLEASQQSPLSPEVEQYQLPMPQEQNRASGMTYQPQSLKQNQTTSELPPPAYEDLEAMGNNRSAVQPLPKPIKPTAPTLDFTLHNFTSSPKVRSTRPRSTRKNTASPMSFQTVPPVACESSLASGINLFSSTNVTFWSIVPNLESNAMTPFVSLCDKLFTSIDSKELSYTPMKILWVQGLLWCTGKDPDGLYVYSPGGELIKHITSSNVSKCNAIVPIPQVCFLAASENGLLLLDTRGEHIFTLAAGAFSDCAYSQDSDDLVGLQYTHQKIFVYRQVSSMLQNLHDQLQPYKVIEIPKPNDFSRFFIFKGEGFSQMDTLAIANHQIYVCRHKSMGPVYCINLNGKIIHEYTGKLTPYPQISCIDNFGNMVLTDSDKRRVIKVCSASGQWRLVDLPGTAETQCGIAIDATGENVWVVTKTQDTFKLVHYLTYMAEIEPDESMDLMYSFDS